MDNTYCCYAAFSSLLLQINNELQSVCECIYVHIYVSVHMKGCAQLSERQTTSVNSKSCDAFVRGSAPCFSTEHSWV